MNPYAPQGTMFDPYANMLGDPYQHDWASQQAQFAQWVDEQERRRQQEQQSSSYNQFGEDMAEYLGASSAPSGVGMGMAGGGGTLQAASLSPLASATPLASQTALGGGSIVGPMSYAPQAAGMSMIGAPGTAGAAAAAAPTGAAGMTAAGTGGAAAGTGGAAAAGGAGAGSGAAGAGMMAAAPWLAIPAAALGTMQWTNNVEDDVNWGTWFTDPGKGWQAAAENISGKLGIEDTPVGNWLEAPMKLIAPRSLDDIGEGINDTLFLDEIGQGLRDLFGGIF